MAHDPGDEHVEHAAPDPVVGGRTEYVRALSVLNQFANGFAAAYGGPVYLVGSGVGAFRLWPDYGYMHDLDLRCVIQQHDVERLFGKKDVLIPMLREQLKQSRRLSRVLYCRVDFQFQTATSLSRYDGKPRERIDTLPDELFDAGLTDA